MNLNNNLKSKNNSFKKWLVPIISIIVFIFIIFNVINKPKVVWEETYNTNTSYFTDVELNSNGNFIVVDSEGIITKLNSRGDKIFINKEYSRIFESFKSIISVSDGYLILGKKLDEYLLLKIDFDGKKRWIKSFNGLHNMEKIDENQIILFGTNENNGYEYLFNIDSNGNERWSTNFKKIAIKKRTVDTSYMAKASINFMTAKKLGDHYVLAGYVDGGMFTTWGYTCILDQYGNEISSQLTGQESDGKQYEDIHEVKDGFVLIGDQYIDDSDYDAGILRTSYLKIFVFKIDESREYRTKYLKTPYLSAFIISSEKLDDNSLLLLGGTFNPKALSTQSNFIMKVNTNGNQKWTKTFSKEIEIESLKKISDKEFILVGKKNNKGYISKIKLP
ncbi:hypothetical protein BX659_1542 [Orenia metallireducens]|uniref:PQQ-like domain-containing protein n=2 Tax=Orenia metallireducens TaxID=1413210 RepID=A0A285IHT0_9FIRM|nr:hypothetical protein [Orenia metallireducens]PRX17218.1 hypothetical protein BX659_1542 [Orenia metallireducens]SNY47560.1 hypothetical protein SAMN06265827_1542 [Orenia metallireducens]